LDVIVTKNVLITSHYRSILPLRNIFNGCNIKSSLRKKYMSWSAGFLLFSILSSIWKSYMVKMDRINSKVEMIENRMFKGEERKMVREISVVKMDIINFWRIIEPQVEILESLSKEGTMFFGEKFAPYFTDILGTAGRAWNSLKTFKETILALEDTNQSLLSTKTNEVIRVLTVFSVILLPLTLIASIWGMNVNLPFSNSPIGFGIILLIMLFSMFFLIFYFRKKRWI